MTCSRRNPLPAAMQTFMMLKTRTYTACKVTLHIDMSVCLHLWHREECLQQGGQGFLSFPLHSTSVHQNGPESRPRASISEVAGVEPHVPDIIDITFELRGFTLHIELKLCVASNNMGCDRQAA